MYLTLAQNLLVQDPIPSFTTIDLVFFFFFLNGQSILSCNSWPFMINTTKQKIFA